jgi:hypothetical protein
MISAGVVRKIDKAIEESGGEVMHEYKVEVTREERWWMVYVPEIDQLTQARRISDITVRIVSIEVPGLGDIAARATAIADARNAAAHAAEAAQHHASEYARALAKAGVPVRDTADLLHVSPQRISQLATPK